MERNIVVIISCLLLVSMNAEAAEYDTLPPELRMNKLVSVQFIEKLMTSHRKTDAKLKEICGSTRNPVQCEQTSYTLQINRTEPITPKDVLLMQVKMTLGTMVLAHSDCVGVTRMNEDKNFGKLYTFCMDSYTKAGKELGEALKACKENDIETTVSFVKTAMKQFEKCAQKVGKASVASPLKETNDFIAKLAENSLAIATTAFNNMDSIDDMK